MAVEILQTAKNSLDRTDLLKEIVIYIEAAGNPVFII